MAYPKILGWTIVKAGRSGGQGVTYLAVPSDKPDATPSRIKFLKKFSKKDLDRFKREAELIQRLDHPNIIKLVECHLDDKRPYIVMTNYVNGSLQGAKDQLKTWSTVLRLKMFISACNGIEEAHKNDIVHRDIKPPNLLINDGRKELVITDFGIAYVDELTRLTETGEKVGSMHYIAPELQVKQEKVDKTCDIYSLGKTLHWMFSGESFPGEEYEATRNNIIVINQDPSLSSINRIIGNAIDVNPKKRYKNVKQLREAVEEAIPLAELGIPQMDDVYYLTYAAASAALRIIEFYDSQWDPNSSTGSMKSVLDRFARLYAEHKEVIARIHDREVYKDLDRAVYFINNRDSKLPRRETISMGDYHLRNAIENFRQNMDLDGEDESYLDAIRNFAKGREEVVFFSSNKARLIPEEYARIRTITSGDK